MSDETGNPIDDRFRINLVGKLYAAIALLEETRDMVMRTQENRSWLERRNRLLGWPPLEKYDPQEDHGAMDPKRWPV